MKISFVISENRFLVRFLLNGIITEIPIDTKVFIENSIVINDTEIKEKMDQVRSILENSDIAVPLSEEEYEILRTKINVTS